MSYLYLILGFIILIKGANYFVDGASNLARHLNWSPFIIGMTIVAFGTSAPEAAVSFSAAIQGESGIALGNVIGSNLINASLIIGAVVLILPLTVPKSIIKKELPVALLGSLLLGIIIFLNQNQLYVISRFEGILLFVLFLLFMIYLFRSGKRDSKNITALQQPVISLKKSIILSLIGLASIILGGELVSTNAAIIANSLGISETVIGLTVVAIGTSLPELVTAIAAALKKETSLALGNIIGSNIFNIFFVLSVSAIINPIIITESVWLDIIILLAITSLLYLFSITNNRRIIRFEGAVLLMSYIFYIAHLLS